MKKTGIALLTAIIIMGVLSFFSEHALAAGASMSTASGNPGDTVQLVLYVNADGATGVQCSITYDTGVFDSVSVAGANSWTVLSSGSFFMSADMTGGSQALAGSTAVAVITAHISPSAARGTAGTITASGIICGDPNGGSIDCGSAVGTVGVNTVPAAPPQNPVPQTPAVKSSNANLSGITVEDGTLSPEFSPEITEYELVFEPYVTEPVLSWTTEDAGAVSEMEGELPDKPEKADVTIRVKAEDGTQKTYLLHCSYSDRPLTPLEMLRLSDEEAKERLKDKDLKEILSVLEESKTLAGEILLPEDLICVEEILSEDYLGIVFAALSEEDQMRILKGEKALVRISFSRIEPEEFAAKELICGMQKEGYLPLEFLRMELEVKIEESAVSYAERLRDGFSLRFQWKVPMTEEEKTISELMFVASEGNGFYYERVPSEDGENFLEIRQNQSGAFVLFAFEEPAEEKEEEKGGLSVFWPILGSFGAGILLTAILEKVGYFHRRKKAERL